MRDENDLSDEEIISMWDHGDPVELVSTFIDVEPSPWVSASAPTGTEAETLLSKVNYPRYFDSHSKGHPPLKEPETETSLEQIGSE